MRTRLGACTRLLAFSLALVQCCVLLALAGCSHAKAPISSAAPHTLVLVSLDGFRADYFDRLPTPHLHALAARGVRAERMRPSFPSKTYPNHFTLVTGKRPEHHGIVANDMFDPASGAWFGLGDRKAVEDPRWWQAEPLWITLEKRGVPTAPLWWPGSEGPLSEIRPSHWLPYGDKLTPSERVERVLDLLALPAAERPRFATLYLAEVDSAGHASGPGSPELAAAVAQLDAAVGKLVAGLDHLGLTATTDLVVVADHGMAEVAEDHAIYLDDLVDLDRAKVVTWSPVLELWPAPADVEAVAAALAANPHLTVYRRGAVPARLHYDDTPRIPPIVAPADEGWGITTHAKHAAGAASHGEHGYDPALPSMGALFVAAGPSFRSGVVVPPFDNVEVYPLLCRTLGIAPLPGDWSEAELPPVLTARNP